MRRRKRCESPIRKSHDQQLPNIFDSVGGQNNPRNKINNSELYEDYETFFRSLFCLKVSSNSKSFPSFRPHLDSKRIGTLVTLTQDFSNPYSA